MDSGFFPGIIIKQGHCYRVAALFNNFNIFQVFNTFGSEKSF